MSDKVLSLIRTYVPIWTAAALVWVASVLNIVIPEEGTTGVILVVVAIVQGLWFWLLRTIEPKLPSWARFLLMGSTKTPIYTQENPATRLDELDHLERQGEAPDDNQPR